MFFKIIEISDCNAINIFHHYIEILFLLNEIKNMNDILMVHFCNVTGFAFELFDDLGIAQEFGFYLFYSDVLAQDIVISFINDAKTTFLNNGQDLVPIIKNSYFGHYFPLVLEFG